MSNLFKKVVYVASGKGGVGKSTIASNLGITLADKGNSVGILDADLHGPSQSEMFDCKSLPISQNGMIVPADRDGIKLISSGMFGGKEKSFIWQGPLLRGVLTQFVRQTAWGSLDYLLVDLPPGTGESLTTLVNIAVWFRYLAGYVMLICRRLIYGKYTTSKRHDDAPNPKRNSRVFGEPR